jgi:hypothetical protein
VTLLPLSLRDKGALPKIAITPATKVVQLRMPITLNTHENYRVDLRTNEGDQIVEFEAKTKAPSEPLILQLPARILKPDDYVLAISGLAAQGLSQNLGEYSFRVLRE